MKLEIMLYLINQYNYEIEKLLDCLSYTNENDH